METDTERWFKKEGEKVLKEIGVKRGHTILDFGCGKGIYSLPAAKIAGEKGKVFALDKSKIELNKLIKKAKSAKLENIETVETSGKLKIPFPNGHFDMVLLYDILHSYYFSPGERGKLLKEAHRVLKPDGLLSVHPEHIEPEEIKREIEGANFHFEKKYFKTLIHDNKYIDTYILNFRKYSE